MSVNINKGWKYVLLVTIIWITYFILQLTSLLIVSGNVDIIYFMGLSLIISLYALPFFLIWLGMFLLFQYIFLQKIIGVYRFKIIPELIAVFLSSFLLAFFAYHKEMGFLIGINYAGVHPTTWSEFWAELKRNNFGLLILMICSILFIVLYQTLIKKFRKFE